MDYSRYVGDFSERGFWEKLAKYALIAGREVIEKALLLWYVLRKPEVPTWAKTIVMGALGYFICPIDAIPDITPMVGYVDDLGILALALATVSVYIDDEVRNQARYKMQEWFSGGWH